MSHLLPCPFCGENNPEIEHMEGTILHPAYVVKCGHCGAQAPWCDKGNHEAKWNQRAKLRAPVSDERAAFEKIAGLLSPNVNLLWNSESDSYRHKSVQSAWRLFSYTNALAGAPVCQRCGGTGEADSGGIHPWGAPALIPCECTISAPVAGEALNDLHALQWAEKYGLQWALNTPDAIREVIADAQRLAAPQTSEAVRDALWTITEHNALHFGEQHNTVIQGRAALSAQSKENDS